MKLLLFYCVCITATFAVNFQVIDLSYELKTFRWPLSQFIKNRGQTRQSQEESNSWLKIDGLTETYLHAPVHLSHHRWSLSEIPTGRFIGSVSVVDLREKVENNADYEISADDLQQWELQHAARLEPLVILWTGWGSRWANKENYLGTSINDPSSLHFPGLHPDAAQWLVDNRRIHGVGIDVMSIDCGQAKRFQTRRILAEENIFLFVNVNTNPLNSTLLLRPVLAIAPLKISAGSGSPVRPLIFEAASHVSVSFIQIKHVFIAALFWMIVVGLSSMISNF